MSKLQTGLSESTELEEGYPDGHSIVSVPGEVLSKGKLGPELRVWDERLRERGLQLLVGRQVTENSELAVGLSDSTRELKSVDDVSEAIKLREVVGSESKWEGFERLGEAGADGIEASCLLLLINLSEARRAASCSNNTLEL